MLGLPRWLFMYHKDGYTHQKCSSYCLWISFSDTVAWKTYLFIAQFVWFPALTLLFRWLNWICSFTWIIRYCFVILQDSGIFYSWEEHSYFLSHHISRMLATLVNHINTPEALQHAPTVLSSLNTVQVVWNSFSCCWNHWKSQFLCLPGVHIARRYGLGSSGSLLSICKFYKVAQWLLNKACSFKGIKMLENGRKTNPLKERMWIWKFIPA
jgi:hypothetical protein